MTATEKTRALELDIRKVGRAIVRSDVRNHPEVAHKVVTEHATGGGDEGTNDFS